MSATENLAASNLERLGRFQQALQIGDIATITSLVHPELTVTEPTGVPYAGVYRGPSGFMQLLGKISTTWTELKIEPKAVFGEPRGDVFAAQVELSGRSVATGKLFMTSFIELWRFRDSKVIELTPYYFDTYYLSEVTGLRTVEI
jgi:ketosteroid isomerase-like protein